MGRRHSHRHRKAGLSPGTLVHIGTKWSDIARVEGIRYSEAGWERRLFTRMEDLREFVQPAHPDEPIGWINVDGVHDVALLEELGKRFDLHPLTLEDIANTEQRPKIEDYDRYLFVVAKMLDFEGKNGLVEVEQLSLVIGERFVLSFQERAGDMFGSVRDRIAGGKGRIRRMGADYLGYALLDAVVDRYFLLIEQVGEHIEALEDRLMRAPSPGALQTVHRLKREMILVRKAVWPMREVINGLIRLEGPLINEATRVFLRDVYDHSIQIIETIETQRDLVAGMMDLYLSSLSHRMNAVMKVLTIIATIFIPLTFITGIYGMNFAHIPLATERWGFHLVITLMAAVGAVMLYFFKQKDWL